MPTLASFVVVAAVLAAPLVMHAQGGGGISPGGARVSSEDVILWPDETWCFRFELSYYTHMSDDYQVILEGSDEYEEFFA